MPKIRVEKTKDFSVVSNELLRDKRLSLQARGLMVFMLSLSDTWEYNIEGLATATGETVFTIGKALIALERTGYLVRKRIRSPNGRLGKTEYTLYEKPILEKPILEKPILEKPILENCRQYNTNIIKNKLIKNQSNKIQKSIEACENADQHQEKIRYADDVFLTETEYNNLRTRLGSSQAVDECISMLSNYKGASGKRYQSDYKAILNWVLDKYHEKHTMPVKTLKNNPVTAAAMVSAMLQPRRDDRAERYSN